ncbi:MAG: hypothetical protein Q8L92_16090, partial [Rubrivivax sp.]|nr:hypothetical protein [Rubrivivax sp.]
LLHPAPVAMKLRQSRSGTIAKRAEWRQHLRDLSNRPARPKPNIPNVFKQLRKAGRTQTRLPGSRQTRQGRNGCSLIEQTGADSASANSLPFSVIVI